MGFKPSTRSRSWMVTVQVQNMINAGLTEEQYKDPEFVLDYFINLWENSGYGRVAAGTTCISADGVYHLHLACYGNVNTLRRVASILCQSHVEPQLGGKKQLKDYIRKQGKYAESDEMILCTKGIDKIKIHKVSEKP